VKHEPSFNHFGNSDRKAPGTEETEHAPTHTPSQTAGKKHEKKHSSKEDEHKKDKKTDHNKDSKEPVKAAGKKPEKAAEKTKDNLETKQEKRAEVVERSLQFKKLYEEVPVPRDPQVLARLLVAEHILAINEQIEEPHEPKTPVDKKALLVALDSMGDLADKLENPELESTPEVQESYEAVMQLAENVLAKGEPVDTVIEANAVSARTFTAESSSPPSEAPAENTQNSASPPATSALIGFLLGRRKRRHKDTNSAHTHAPILPTATSTDFGGGMPPPTISRSRNDASATTTHPLARPEVIPGRSPRRLSRNSPGRTPSTGAPAFIRSNCRARCRLNICYFSQRRLAVNFTCRSHFANLRTTLAIAFSLFDSFGCLC